MQMQMSTLTGNLRMHHAAYGVYCLTRVSIYIAPGARDLSASHKTLI
jgi:hypothetical protein